MPPKKMQYSTQSIIWIAEDLKGSAETLQGKRIAAGDGDDKYEGIGTVAKSKIFSGVTLEELPAVYRQPDSRMIILGHGHNNGQAELGISNGTQVWTSPKDLSDKVRKWLGGNRIKRISLHMCYGGGYRKGANSLDGFTIAPKASFAFKFASMAGVFCESVTARTDTTHMTSTSTNNVITSAKRIVGDTRHKQPLDKIIFETVGGSWSGAPSNPAIMYFAPK